MGQAWWIQQGCVYLGVDLVLELEVQVNEGWPNLEALASRPNLWLLWLQHPLCHLSSLVVYGFRSLAPHLTPGAQQCLTLSLVGCAETWAHEEENALAWSRRAKLLCSMEKWRSTFKRSNITMELYFQKLSALKTSEYLVVWALMSNLHEVKTI